MAAGGVGGYFGARMAAAGHDVSFIARGAHLKAIRDKGLMVQSVHGDLHLPKPNVTDDPAAVGPVDIVLFAVKLWDTEKAAELSRPLIGRGTCLITTQNGIDSVERIASVIGAEHVAMGVTQIATVIGAPGVISHTSHFARIRVGRLDGKPDAKLSELVEAAKAAKVDITFSDDIGIERWRKFVYLVTMSAVTASTRMPIGKIMADADARAFALKVMDEVIAVGKASGIAFPPSIAADGVKFLENAPAGMKASMAHDLERGNRMELDWLSGKVVELGKKLGIPTPANADAYAVLKLHRMGTAA
jgi:2-dehydropantoate 2-reductase